MVEVSKKFILLFLLFILFIMKYTFKDITDLFVALGKRIYPTHPEIGIGVLVFILVISIFYREIKNFTDRITVK
jgi:hypothetical protein